MGVAYYVHLLGYCGFDACVAVAEARDCGAARGIKDTLAIAEGYVEALGVDNAVGEVVEVAVEDVGLGVGRCVIGIVVLDWLSRGWHLADVAIVEGRER